MNHHRWALQQHLKADPKPDMFAFETAGRLDETQAICRLLQTEFPDQLAYFALVSKDKETIVSGTKIREVAAFLHTIPQVAMIGINCCDPENCEELINEIRSQTDKPLINYPNSGEVYDGYTRTWSGKDKVSDIPRFV